MPELFLHSANRPTTKGGAPPRFLHEVHDAFPMRDAQQPTERLPHPKGDDKSPVLPPRESAD